MISGLLQRNLRSIVCLNSGFRAISSSAQLRSVDGKPPEMIDVENEHIIQIPTYQPKKNEPLHLQKARLMYQSRKRGMLENGLLLSTFASKYLDQMDERETALYDRLINLPTNDWDIFYWATGVKETPPEYDNEMMAKLRKHVSNAEKEERFHQPSLY